MKAPQASQKRGPLPPDYHRIGSWQFLHTHDLITLSAVISTKRETIPTTIHKSHTTMRVGGAQW